MREDIDVYRLVNAILYGSRRKIIQSSQYKTHNIDHIRDEEVIASMDSYTILLHMEVLKENSQGDYRLVHSHAQHLTLYTYFLSNNISSEKRSYRTISFIKF